MADPPPNPAERRNYLEQRIAWNQKNIDSLGRDRRRIPFLFGMLLLAFPAGFKFGAVGVVIIIVATLVTVATAYYLTWGHRTEYEEKIAELRSELDEMDAARRAEQMRRLSESS